MRLRNIIALLVLSVLTVSCGPIMGQMMRMSEGIKSFEVTAGSISDLKKGQNLLVIGPFAKTDTAYYIARGDEAAIFPREFEKTGFFAAESHLEFKYNDLNEMISALRSKNAAALKDDLGLQRMPDIIMFGTILDRDTIVAPMRGIIMRVSYRLEFFNVQTKSSTIIEITIKDRFRDCISRVAQEIVKRVEQQ